MLYSCYTNILLYKGCPLILLEILYNYFSVVFLNSIALTAMAFIMERKEGVFERAYSAGIEHKMCVHV